MSKKDKAVIGKIDQIYLGVDRQGSIGVYFEFDKRCYCEEEYISYSGIRYFDQGLPSKSIDKIAEYIIEGDGHSTLCVDDEVAPSFDRDISELNGDVSFLSSDNLKIYEYLDANLDKIEDALNKFAQNLHNYAVFDDDGQLIGYYDELNKKNEPKKDDKDIRDMVKSNPTWNDCATYVAYAFIGAMYYVFDEHLSLHGDIVDPSQDKLPSARFFLENKAVNEENRFGLYRSKMQPKYGLEKYDMPSYFTAVRFETMETGDPLIASKVAFQWFFNRQILENPEFYNAVDSATRHKLDILKNPSDSFIKKMHSLGMKLGLR